MSGFWWKKKVELFKTCGVRLDAKKYGCGTSENHAEYPRE
jgi:hypothetical protein